MQTATKPNERYNELMTRTERSNSGLYSMSLNLCICIQCIRITIYMGGEQYTITLDYIQRTFDGEVMIVTAKCEYKLTP